MSVHSRQDHLDSRSRPSETRRPGPLWRLFHRKGTGSWQREHVGLRRALALARLELDEVAARLERGTGATWAVRRVVRRLQGLERFLAAHFAHEEGPGGALELALQAAPRFQGQAQRLHREHAELLREIHEIQELARHAGRSPEGWAGIRQAYEALAERLQHHDEAENEIVTSSVLQDIGPGD